MWLSMIYELDGSCQDISGQHVGTAQSEALHCLHDDLQALAQRQLGCAEFAKRWPVTQITQWERWQPHLQEDTIAYFDLSCLLAYYAVDYEVNVRRLLQARHPLCHSAVSLTTREVHERSGCLPGYLSVVYRRQRDLALLHALLELRMPSFRLRRTHWEAIAGLWDRHRVALLRAATISPAAQQTLLDTFVHVCRTVGEPTLWRAYCRHLQSATYLRDRQITRTALCLTTLLRQAERRYERE